MEQLLIQLALIRAAASNMRPVAQRLGIDIEADIEAEIDSIIAATNSGITKIRPHFTEDQLDSINTNKN